MIGGVCGKTFHPRAGGLLRLCLHASGSRVEHRSRSGQGWRQGLGMALTFSPFSNCTVPSALQLLGTSLQSQAGARGFLFLNSSTQDPIEFTTLLLNI